MTARHHFPRARTSLAVALASLALLAGACGGDDEGGEFSAKTTTTEKSDAGKATDEESSTTAAPDDGGETTTTAAADFNEGVDAATKALESAEDPCDVFDALTNIAAVGDPTSREETEKATKFVVLMLRKMAETTSDPALATTLEEGATAYEEFGEKNDYDPGAMNLSGDGPDIPEAEAIDTAMNTYSETEMASCMDSAESVPGSSGAAPTP